MTVDCVDGTAEWRKKGACGVLGAEGRVPTSEVTWRLYLSLRL